MGYEDRRVMYGSPEVKDLGQHQLMISGLLRYRSAPSSVFEEFDAQAMLASFPVKPPEEDQGFTLAPAHLLYRHAQSAAAMEAEQQLKSSSGLVRQSSSPAGLVSGYGTSDVGAPASRRRNQGRQPSMMSQISEIGSEGMAGSSSPEEQWYPMPSSWDDDAEAPAIPTVFPAIKRERDVRAQNGDGLAHQYSVPRGEMENFLQFQDTVPCKVRAKRGCATHPRSIAERVRRTRISERMRKLQELVPNMDKQTNTADMLDLAVEYIKELQRQVKSMSESRACCSCSSENYFPSG